MESSLMEAPNTERSKEFWSRVDDVRAGMLGLEVANRMVPMTHHADEAASTFWFIAADGTDIVNSLKTGPRSAHYTIASARDGIYANVIGALSIEEDDKKLDELWNSVADAWFEEGRRDPEVRLVKLRLEEAEVWSTTTGALSFAYHIAKAKIAEKKPDLGENYVLSF
jgi:general stress protein 26